jgi:hypothetical protein
VQPLTGLCGVVGRIVATDMEALTGLGEAGLGETGLGETGLGETGLGETGLGETGCFADGLASHIRTSLNGNIPRRMFSNCFTMKWG